MLCGLSVRVRGVVVRIGFVAVRQFCSRKTATPHSLGRYGSFSKKKRIGETVSEI